MFLSEEASARRRAPSRQLLFPPSDTFSLNTLPCHWNYSLQLCGYCSDISPQLSTSLWDRRVRGFLQVSPVISSTIPTISAIFLRMDAIVERVSSHPVITAATCIILYTFYTRLTAPTLVPKNIPWVGKQSDRLFSETWAALRSIAHVPVWLKEGYEEVCQLTTPRCADYDSLLTIDHSTRKMTKPT